MPNRVNVSNTVGVCRLFSGIRLITTEDYRLCKLLIMRLLFIAVLLANVALLAFGQGFMGTPPSEEGRTPRLLSERNQHVVQFGPARLAPPSQPG